MRSLIASDQAHQAARRFTHELVELTVLVRIAEVKNLELQNSQARPRANLLQSVRMRVHERLKKGALFTWRKMANLEDDFEMRCRNRDGICRVRNMRDETAVLAKRGREPLPCAGRSLIEDIAKDSLVGLNISGFFVTAPGVIHPSPPERSTAAIACLVRAMATGATERARSPAFNSASTSFGSPPASPQRLTFLPVGAPCAATCAIRRRTAGLAGSLSAATVSRSRAAAMTYWVRSFEPIE